MSAMARGSAGFRGIIRSQHSKISNKFLKMMHGPLAVFGSQAVTAITMGRNVVGSIFRRVVASAMDRHNNVKTHMLSQTIGALRCWVEDRLCVITKEQKRQGGQLALEIHDSTAAALHAALSAHENLSLQRQDHHNQMQQRLMDTQQMRHDELRSWCDDRFQAIEETLAENGRRSDEISLRVTRMANAQADREENSRVLEAKQSDRHDQILLVLQRLSGKRRWESIAGPDKCLGCNRLSGVGHAVLYCCEICKLRSAAGGQNKPEAHDHLCTGERGEPKYKNFPGLNKCEGCDRRAGASRFTNFCCRRCELRSEEGLTFLPERHSGHCTGGHSNPELYATGVSFGGSVASNMRQGCTHSPLLAAAVSERDDQAMQQRVRSASRSPRRSGPVDGRSVPVDGFGHALDCQCLWCTTPPKR